MKKFISFSLAALLLFSLYSCGKDAESADEIPVFSAADVQEGIQYKMETEFFDIEDEDGRLVFSGSVSYPFFFGSSVFEIKANRYFESYKEEFRKKYTADELTGRYGRPEEVAYSENIDFQISYLKHNLISFAVYENSFFEGKRNSVRGVIADTGTVRVLSPEEILRGSKRDRQKVYEYYYKQQNEWTEALGRTSHITDSEPFLTEEGLVFPVSTDAGKAFINTVIPFSEVGNPVISADRLLKRINK